MTNDNRDNGALTKAVEVSKSVDGRVRVRRLLPDAPIFSNCEVGDVVEYYRFVWDEGGNRRRELDTRTHVLAKTENYIEVEERDM